MMMRHIYRIVIILLSVFVFQQTQAQTSSDSIIVQKTDSSIVCFLFSEAPTMKFAGDSLRIFGNDTLSVLFSDVRKIYFSTEKVPTSIPEVKSVETIKISGGSVYVYGENVANVAVFSINGTQMPLDVAYHQDGASFSFSQLPKGIYIIRTNKQTFKIVKR